MQKRILITGASGFVGSHLVDRALAEGYEVYAGLRASSSRKYLQDGRIRVFPFDSAEPEDLRNELQKIADREGGFDAVVHSAAVTKPRRISEFHEGNAEFTEMFAAMLRDTQPGFGKFIYISSIAAQGPGGKDMVPIHENSIHRPITPYGKSKLGAEERLAALEDFPWLILRPAAIYGPRDEKFILRVIKMLKAGLAVKLGSQEQRQSFLYVSDLVDVVFDSLELDLVQKTYVLGDGKAYNQDEFFRIIADTMGIRPVSIRIPKPVTIGIGHVMQAYASLSGQPLHLSPHKMREITAENWHVDIGLAKRELGYTPKVSLEEGIDRTISWYRSEGLL